MTGRADDRAGERAARTESENTDRKRIQSAPAPDRTRPPATASPQNRGIPTISRQHGNRTPNRQARYRPNPRTESGITRRNRNQSASAPTDTHPTTPVLPQNRRIPTIRTHHHHQPSPNQPPRTPEPRTESENGNRKPIQSATAPPTHAPATPATPQTRGITGI